jgi:hypothetical protein
MLKVIDNVAELEDKGEGECENGCRELSEKLTVGCRRITQTDLNQISF